MRLSEDYAFPALVGLAIVLLLQKRMRQEMVYLGKYAFFIGMTLAITVFYIPVFLLRPRDVRNFQLMRWPAVTAAKYVEGMKFKLRNEEVLSDVDGAVVVCNHQSALDVIGMLNMWYHLRKCAVVSKKELLWAFPFGLSLWLAGVLFINRKNPHSSYQVLNDAAQILNTKKTKVWIFPEGTRNKHVRDTGTLLPFKRGAFKMAISAQVPIVPVVNSPYYFVSGKTRIFGNGTVITEILDPIDTKGLTEADTEALMLRTQKAMQEKYDQLKKDTLYLS